MLEICLSCTYMEVPIEYFLVDGYVLQCLLERIVITKPCSLKQNPQT
jgi:hypothetical protein